MSLTILTIITIITSPWFFLITFEKLFPAKFYLPNIGEFLNNFFSYFSFDYLFFVGDPIFKNSIPEIGVFHLWQLPFFLIGLYFILSNIKKNHLIMTFLISSLIIASFFKSSPNILISLPFLFLVSIVISKGMDLFLTFSFKKRNLINLILIFLLMVFSFYNLFFLCHQFKVHYPKRIEKESGKL